MSRVLIVDDEPDVCDALCRVLKRAGYDPVFALDAESALELQRSDCADVVITDIIMPGQDGVELIKTLREKYPHIGIVAISGGGNVALAGYQPDAIKTAAYIAAAEKAGADCCLTKPFERADLLNTVADLMKPRIH